MLILFVVSVLEGIEVARVSKGGTARPAMLGATHGLAALSLVVIVFLTILGR